MSDAEDKIRVDHVSKCFKMYNTSMDKMKEAFSPSGRCRHTDFYAITDLSFLVKSGEILGIMGRNGSGKSTLLKLIAGIYEPSGGEVVVSGRISSLLELGIGFNMEYTGIENIYFYGTLMGFSKKQMDQKVQEIVDFAEIGDYIYQSVKTYSSGMFARLAFSCAVSVEPDILIVDEILSVGDMRFQAKCFNKFKEFKEKGVTILYVGHDVGMMRTFCDTAMWMDKGKLVDIGDPTYISAKYTEFMYLDDISDFTDYKRVEDQCGEFPLSDDGESAGEIPGNKKEDSALIPKQEKRKSDRTKFPDCIAHWGSRIGLLRSAAIYDTAGNEQMLFSADDTMKIMISFDLDEDINIDKLSVAVSIKNTEGTDIIVKTTYDEHVKLRTGKDQKIVFELVPRLANGDYYLVVAMENREDAAMAYYEYVEGAIYFKVYSEKKIFGIYDVPAMIKY